jgi:hypothetical protein
MTDRNQSLKINIAALAQLVEQRSCKATVVGSNPARGTNTTPRGIDSLRVLARVMNSLVANLTGALCRAEEPGIVRAKPCTYTCVAPSVEGNLGSKPCAGQASERFSYLTVWRSP